MFVSSFLLLIFLGGAGGEGGGEGGVGEGGGEGGGGVTHGKNTRAVAGANSCQQRSGVSEVGDCGTELENQKCQSLKATLRFRVQGL